MKKPTKGKKKAVKNRIAKKRFVSKAEKRVRRENYRKKQELRAHLLRKLNNEMYKLLQQSALEASEGAEGLTEDTEDALFDNQESESKD